MKLLKLFTLFAFTTLTVNAQTKPASSKTTQEPSPAPTTRAATASVDTLPLEIKIYNRAMMFGDYIVAKDAMFSLIAKNPERIDYIDSIARIYYGLGAYPQSLLASKIVLDKSPDNLEMLELSAISQDALGNKKEALESYEKLYPQTKNLHHLYQIAVLQFSLQRYGECGASTDKILTDPEASKQKVSFNVDQNSSQQVPLSAAVHNLRGVMYKEMNNPDKSKTEFELAIKESPEFELAKSNLDILNNPPKQESTDKDKKKK